MSNTEMSTLEKASDIAEDLLRSAKKQTEGDELLAMTALAMCVGALAKQMNMPIKDAIEAVSFAYAANERLSLADSCSNRQSVES